MDRTRGLRRLVRRSQRGGATVDDLDGRQARRLPAVDDVRGTRAPRDPLGGRLPRSRSAGAARLHHLRPAPRRTARTDRPRAHPPPRVAPRDPSRTTPPHFPPGIPRPPPPLASLPPPPPPTPPP